MFITLRRLQLVLPTSGPIPRVLGFRLTSHFGELKTPIISKPENVYAPKFYESFEVDRRTWLHVPSGTLGPPAVLFTK